MQSYNRQHVGWGGGAVLAVVLFVVLLVIIFLLPAPRFTADTVTIPRGATVSQAADRLADSGVILHPTLVSVPIWLRGQSVTAGTYRFSQPVSPLVVARRLAAGDFQIPQTEVVIPEGFTRQQIADRLAGKLGAGFSRERFMQITKGLEGYLFPDTYRLYPDATPQEVASVMRANFDDHIATLQSQLQNFPHSQEAVIKMASLVEREAADYQTRRRVAGVLWDRFERGMPLQADAVFVYLLGKSSSELTQADLAVDSPYNLYEHTGLPPTPIANPGLEAIRATINPIRTDDLYYLTGDNGNFYFAETLEEHQRNKRRYLR